MIVALVLALTGLLSAAAALIGLFRKVREIHVLVNSNLNKVMARLGIEQQRTTQLSDTMKAGDMPVPPRPPDPSP